MLLEWQKFRILNFEVKAGVECAINGQVGVETHGHEDFVGTSIGLDDRFMGCLLHRNSPFKQETLLATSYTLEIK